MDIENKNQENWEFKIVWSGTGAFRKYDNIQKTCEDEAREGWELIEIFDSNRLRFKRRIDGSMGSSSGLIHQNAGSYDTPSGSTAAIIILGVTLVVAGIVSFLVWYNR